MTREGGERGGGGGREGDREERGGVEREGRDGGESKERNKSYVSPVRHHEQLFHILCISYDVDAANFIRIV